MDFNVSSSSEHGRLEQIISQFLLKALHIVLESRIPSLKPQDHSGELSNSKARRTDKWFNLALGDRPASLEKLQYWHRNLMDPMVIDIIVIRRGLDDSTGNYSYYEQVFDGDAVETVVERWVIQYENYKTLPVQTRDISLLYKKMYQKSIILFRSLYLMMRHLPAYKIFRHRSSLNQTSNIDVIYKVSSFSDPFSREEEQMMKHYSFNPIEAINGRLCVSVTYRSNLSEFDLNSSTALPPVIITDYVGSPATDPLRAFPSLDRLSHPASFSSRGTRAACSTPSQRPHSWSSGIHFAAARMQNYPLSGSPSAHRSTFAPNDDPSLLTYSQDHRVQNYGVLGGHHITNSYEESLSPPFSPSSSPSPPAYLLRYSPNQSRLRPESAPVAIPYAMLNRSPRHLSPNLSDPNRLPLPPFSPKNSKPDPSPHGSSSPSGHRVIRKLDAVRLGESHSGMSNLSFGSKISRDSKDESGRFSGLHSSGSSPRKAFSRTSSRLSFQDELDVCDFSCPFDVDVDDVDTSDTQPSHSFDSKKGSDFNSAFSLGRKSQDAAVGALVHMLRTAPPLRQDSSIYSAHSQSTHQGNFGTASEFLMSRKASDALEELKSYREMKDLLLSKSKDQAVNNDEDRHGLPLNIKGKKL
ncbi:unnamed protein product [Amaranthus hypochondriacus]